MSDIREGMTVDEVNAAMQAREVEVQKERAATRDAAEKRLADIENELSQLKAAVAAIEIANRRTP